MKKLIRLFTVCLLLVCLSFSLVACNEPKKPAGPGPETSVLGDNLGNVSEAEWISALTLPEAIDNFYLISKNILEDSLDSTNNSEYAIELAISKTDLFGTESTISYDENDALITYTSVVALTQVQEIYYTYTKTIKDNVTYHDISGDLEITPEDMYFNTLSNMSIYKDYYSSFTFNTEKNAFVYNNDTQIQLAIYENGFSIKRIQTMGTLTMISEYAFANINSTTVSVPQYVINDINTFIANPDAFTPFPEE